MTEQLLLDLVGALALVSQVDKIRRELHAVRRVILVAASNVVGGSLAPVALGLPAAVSSVPEESDHDGRLWPLKRS